MLYLEDYLEMIEHLPQELRDRFTEMRELDLTVQNSMDSLEKKTRQYFLQCKRGEITPEEIESEFQNMRDEYFKVLEDADEKVAIATQIHELVERYTRRLDSELHKFKCELEADNIGITEILEKRSLEMDGASTAATSLLNIIGTNQKENRYYGTPASTNNHSSLGMSTSNLGLGSMSIPTTPTSSTKERYRASRPEKRRDSTNINSLSEKRPTLTNSLTPTTTPLNVMRPLTPGLSTHSVLNTPTVTATPPPSTVAYNLGGLGASASTAIAAAASQAIVATQQMQQGRRTASLKASYEAIHGAGGGPTEFWINRDIANAAAVPTLNPLQNAAAEKKQKKKLNTSLGVPTANTATLSSANSIASSSSSVSVDSMDMLPSTSTVVGTSGMSSLSNLAGLSNVASTSGANRGAGSASSSSTSSSALATTSNLTLTENGLVMDPAAEAEWTYDPNEPRYCTCNQVSYGDMVACDNDACPYEWFHYPCVGITQPPKGKWYCPKCTASMRRRGNRKN